MKAALSRIWKSKYGWIFLLVLLVAVNYLASLVHSRVDLTREKRYTLSRTTRDFLSQIDEDVQIDVFLKGEFPAGFRKLAISTDEFLRLLKERNGSRIHYRFISPEDPIPGTQTNYGDSLVKLGAVPINLTVQKKAGESSNIIFPVALMRYKGRQSLVNLYPGASGRISQEEINSAEAMMEYQFVNAMSKLTQTGKPGIAYHIGNGEPVDARTYDLRETLSTDYSFGLLNLNTQPAVPAGVDILLVVKPTQGFSEAEKFKIDQFVMRGGKLLCFIDNLIAEQDSLAFKPEQVAFDRNLNLTDLFFRYGLRINTDLVMDLQCDYIPFIVGGTQDNPQYEFLRWNYYPLLSPAVNSINRNPGYVSAQYANSIDTIRVDGVSKIPLLVTSPNSRTISTPALISLNENKNVPEDEKFRKSQIPVGMLLEGHFTSLYNNRVTQSQLDSLKALNTDYRSVSVPNKMIVVADGNIVLNDFTSQGEGQPVPLPMGWNKFTYSEYERQSDYGRLFIPVANRQFLLNAVEYLVNDPAVSLLRNKEIVLRLLDSRKVNAQKASWQFINTGLPVILILLAGFIYQALRKRKYVA
jgi:gliding-associated putative ABC transporter substrate-binding component GldG